MTMKQEAIESATAAVASKATYGGAGTSMLGWAMSNEFAVLMGLVVGVLGLVVNFYFKLKRDRREQAAHELRMAELRTALSRSNKP